MTKLLDKAFSELRKLPDERQDAIAALLLHWAEEDREAVALTPEQEAELDAGLREADAGAFASEEDMQRLYRKIGL